MSQAKKGNQYYFGMKAHIDVDDESGLVHSLVETAANVADITQVDKLLPGEENMVRADAGYAGIKKRPEHEGSEGIWQIAARRSTYIKLHKRSALYKTKRKMGSTPLHHLAGTDTIGNLVNRLGKIKCNSLHKDTPNFSHHRSRYRTVVRGESITAFNLIGLWRYSCIRYATHESRHVSFAG